jgi:WD repeat-containing protein 19
MAVAGESMIKIYNLATWKELRNERIELPKSAGRVHQIEWSANGQLLVVSTLSGNIYGFLTSIPFITSTFGSITGVLTSFTEVSLLDTSRQGQTTNVSAVRLENEPTIISIGPFHLAAGINNVVWFYLWLDSRRGGVIKDG